jgi:putative tricarboxylic transport membrane protein
MFAVIAFGGIGYLMKKIGLEPGPLVLAFVLGSLLETSFRQSMRIFEGDPTGFVTRPISATLLFVVLLVAVVMPAIRQVRKRMARPEHLVDA